MKYSARASQTATKSERKRSIRVASSARGQDRSTSKPFAVFDIDGTLIRWQLYHAVVDKLAKSGALGEDAHKQLHDARMIWKRREHQEAFRAYESALIKVYETALPTLQPEVFDQMVHAVIDEYKDQVYTYTRDLIRELRGQGYFLLAISGSHQELVKEIAAHYQFDDCVGTRYSRQSNKFTGKKFVASLDKKTILEKLIAKHELTGPGSVAVGDSGSDVAMLEMVEQPIAFNPDQRLFDIAKKHGWKIVIERKNVVYGLERKNERYVLA